MSTNRLLKQTSEWLRGTGPNADIVLSSRIRLARNLNGVPFSHWAAKRQEKEIQDKVSEAAKNAKSLKASFAFQMDEISDLDKHFLLERRLVSRELVNRPEGRSVIVSEREIISLMINEEDHIRIQVMQSGFNLQEGWKIADQLDSDLSKELDIAFSDDLGFLTSCPTNTGTGLRASMMLHLPALVISKQINRLVQAVTKLGMTVRGLYGEGTESEGNLFQISNQVTLGQSEEETIDRIERMIRQLIGHEETARKQLLKQNGDLLRDKIWRAYGILKNAYIVTSKESTALLSMLRLGVDLGVLTQVDRAIVNELFILTQPAHLQRMEGKLLAQSERDTRRAQLLREQLHAG